MADPNDIFGGLTAEEIKALLATIGDPAELEAIQGQQEIADKLRTPHDHHGYMAGNVYIPDIAGSLGGIGEAYFGKKMDKANAVKRKELYGKQAAASKTYLDALTNRHAAAAPVAAPPPSPPPPSAPPPTASQGGPSPLAASVPQGGPAGPLGSLSPEALAKIKALLGI